MGGLFLPLGEGPSVQRRVGIGFVAALTLAGLVAVVYWPVGGYGFVDFDDNVYLVENERVADGLTVSNIRWAFTTRHHANWHPLTWLSYLVDVELFGLRPGPMHRTNAIIHFANSWLLFALLASATGSWARSALVAALFAVHPLHVESVAWISERKDVLCTLFVFGALWAYVRFTQLKTLRWYLLTGALGAMALMAKPMAITLPLLMLLFDYRPLNRLDTGKSPPALRVIVWEKIPFFVLAFACGVLTLWAQYGGESIQGTGTIPMGQRLANAAVSLVEYVKLTIWPSDLAVFYPHPKGSLSAIQVGQSAAILFVITALGFRFRRVYPAFLMGWLWFVVSLLPVIGLVQVGAQAMADRYTYVSLVGLFIAVAWFPIPNFVRPKSPFALVLGVCAAVVLISFTLISRLQVRHWEDTESLFQHAVAVTEENVLAHDILGRYYLKNRRYAEAATRFRAGLTINPDYPEGRLNLGLALLPLGQYEGAVAMLQGALKEDGERVDTHVGLARAYSALKREDDLRRHFEAALSLKPGNAVIHTAYGNALSRLSDSSGGEALLREAIEHYEASAGIDPDYALAYLNMGMALSLLGEEERSQASLNKALELDPSLKIPSGLPAESMSAPP